MRNWVIVDLDMTLIDTRELVLSGGPEPEVGTPEHQQWVLTVTDPEVLAVAPPVEAVLRLVKSMSNRNIVFITNRRESLRTLTQLWLLKHSLFQPLMMRPNGLNSPAGEFKASVINKMVGPNDTVLVIDDDNDRSIEEACKQHGWTHFKVTTYEALRV